MGAAKPCPLCGANLFPSELGKPYDYECFCCNSKYVESERGLNALAPGFE